MGYHSPLQDDSQVPAIILVLYQKHYVTSMPQCLEQRVNNYLEEESTLAIKANIHGQPSLEHYTSYKKGGIYVPVPVPSRPFLTPFPYQNAMPK